MELQGVVLNNVVNLFSEPDTAVEVVTQAIVGTSLSIEKSADGWH